MLKKQILQLFLFENLKQLDISFTLFKCSQILSKMKLDYIYRTPINKNYDKHKNNLKHILEIDR